MNPANILAMIGGSFLGGLDRSTLWATAMIVVIWWVYKETVWEWVRKG